MPMSTEVQFRASTPPKSELVQHTSAELQADSVDTPTCCTAVQVNPTSNPVSEGLIPNLGYKAVAAELSECTSCWQHSTFPLGHDVAVGFGAKNARDGDGDGASPADVREAKRATKRTSRTPVW